MLGKVFRAVGASMLTVGVVTTVVLGACADKKGALMLAINTDMRAPKDVNAVSVTISTNGAIKHSFIGRVTPQGEVLLPATLAIVWPISHWTRSPTMDMPRPVSRCGWAYPS